MQDICCSVPASCGEWLQGWLDGEALLVSCPIERRVRARLNSEERAGVHVTPADCVKAQQAAYLVLERANGSANRCAYSISIQDGLERSRGYATSTADVVATSAVLATALNVALSEQELAQIACQIEPSDSIMFSGWCALAYRSAAWHQALGEGLRLPLLVLDAGVEVDTLAFNRSLDWKRVAALEAPTRQALALLQAGMNAKDWRLLGAAARLSASTYQAVCHSSLVESALDWAVRLGAGGPLRAHSGSIVGLLFAEEEQARSAMRRLAGEFKGSLALTHTAPGGVQRERF